MLKIQALYSRVSTEVQRDKGFSIPRQKEWLEEAAKSRGFNNFQHFVDDGYSATNIRRPAYLQLISKIEAGLINAVVLYKYDRVARNVRDLLDFVDLLAKHDVNFISLSENLDTTTPTGRLILTVLGSLAEWERSITVERVKDVMYDKAKKGDFCGGPAPYGYDVIGKHLIINEKEAGLVKAIFKKFEELRSFRGVVIWLNNKGYLTKKGLSWAASTTRRILTNPLYIGFYTYGKRAGNSKVCLPEERWLVSKGDLEPIVPEPQFERVQALIRQRKFTHPKRHGVIYLLSGLLRCAECGGALCGHTQRKPKSGKLYSSYRCHYHLSKGDKICSGVIIKKDKLESEVIDKIRNTAKLHFEESEANEIITQDMDNPQESVIRIEENINSVKNKQLRLLTLFEDDRISRDALAERMDRTTIELDNLQIQKDALLSEINPQEKGKRIELLEKIKDINGDFLSYSDKAKKTILQQLIKQIIVSKNEGIEIELYEL